MLEQLHMRYVNGESTDERMADKGELMARQVRRAATILDRAGLWREFGVRPMAEAPAAKAFRFDARLPVAGQS